MITGRCDVITWTFQPMNFSTHPHIYYHFRYIFLSSVFLIYLFINNIDFSLSLCVVLFLFFNLISTQTYIPIHVHLGLACIHTDTLTLSLSLSLSLSLTHTHTHINICIYEFASSLIFCEVTNLFLPRITHCSNLSRPELKSFSKLIRSTIISEKLFGFFFRWFTYDYKRKKKRENSPITCTYWLAATLKDFFWDTRIFLIIFFSFVSFFIILYVVRCKNIFAINIRIFLNKSIQ